MEGMKFSRGPMIAITVLRVFVGWHFLYEGLTKLTAPSWSAAGYLNRPGGRLPSSSGGWPPGPICSPMRTSSRCGGSRWWGCS